MNGAPVLNDRAGDHRPRSLGQQAQLQQMLLDLGPIPAGAADPHEDGAFETVHHAILVSGRRIVNARAGRNPQ